MGRVKRKYRSTKTRFKRGLRSIGSWFRRNKRDVAEETTETVLDVDSPSFRRWGGDTDLPDWMVKKPEPPSSSSRSGPSSGSDSILSGRHRSSSSDSPFGSSSSRSHSSGGDGCGPDLDGCGDGCSGCSFDLLLIGLMIPSAIGKILYYNTKGYAWHERHEHNHRT